MTTTILHNNNNDFDIWPVGFVEQVKSILVSRIFHASDATCLFHKDSFPFNSIFLQTDHGIDFFNLVFLSQLYLLSHLILLLYHICFTIVYFFFIQCKQHLVQFFFSLYLQRCGFGFLILILLFLSPYIKGLVSSIFLGLIRLHYRTYSSLYCSRYFFTPASGRKAQNTVKNFTNFFLSRFFSSFKFQY